MLDAEGWYIIRDMRRSGMSISAIARRTGISKNTISRSETGLIAEGYQRFWSYDEVREYGERNTKSEVKSMNEG